MADSNTGPDSYAEIGQRAFTRAILENDGHVDANAVEAIAKRLCTQQRVEYDEVAIRKGIDDARTARNESIDLFEKRRASAKPIR